MNYYIIRNGNDFGPYDIATIAEMVARGRVLKCDRARPDGGIYDGRTTVGDCLRREGVKVSVRRRGSVVSQIKSIGSEILFPKGDMSRGVWRQDSRLLVMAAVGLLPAVVEIFGGSSVLTFYFISLYFSGVWGLFFYYLFKTRQVSARSAVITFFLTQVFVFVAWDVFGIVALNPFYGFEEARSFVGQALFYVCGVGLTEEFAKALPLFIIVARAREPLVPQTMVFYGLVSGIAFGVFEGVQYQLTVNAEYGYSESFFMNITRLTTLPFAHALWAGVAGYFISFAQLFPAYKWALRVLAVAIPALLHGAYDFACSYAVFGLVVRVGLIFFSALLLMTYLNRGKDLQSRLSNLTHAN